MKSFKLAIWGSGENCTRACDFFRELPNFTIVGIIQSHDLDTTAELLNHFYQTTGLDVLAAATENDQIVKHLNIHKPSGVQILESKGLDILYAFANAHSGAYPISDNSIAEDLDVLAQELHRSSVVIKEIQNKLSRNEQGDTSPNQILSMDDMEQILLKQALNKYGYTVEGKKEAAKALKISLATLYNKLKKYRIS